MVSAGNPARLKVKTFFIRFTHGKGLAGQGSVTHDGAKKIVFGNGREIEADVALLTTNTGDRLVTVDVIDTSFGSALQVIIEKIL